MDCADTKPLLPSYVRDELGGPDRGAVAEHLAVCDDCSLAVDLLRHPPATPAESAADWTVEKIFSDAGGAEEAGAPRAPDSHAVAEPNAVAMPPAEPASMFAPPPDPAPTPARAPDPAPSPIVPAPPAPAPSGPEKNDWDFEPAGANVESAPPDESLQLAEETLVRRRGRSQARNGAVRALVWGVGGVAGLGLLGASIWVAINVHPAATGVNPVSPAAPHAASPAPHAGSTAPPRDAASPAPPESLPRPVTAGSMAVGATPETFAPPPAGSGAPAPAPEKRPPAVAATIAPPPAAGKHAAPAPAKPAPSAAPARPDTHAPLVTPPADRAAAAPSAAPNPKPVPDDVDMWPVDDPVATAPAKAPPAKAPIVEKPLVTDAAPAAPPPSADPAAPAPPTAESPKPKAPRTEIDRLHEATEKAAGEADLDALRRLRDAWKNHLKTVVGPTRSRAKREYADCLWAIQLLTGRQDDQREALLAYRDFLISAPAGGTDPRSAARLRQLEDVMGR